MNDFDPKNQAYRDNDRVPEGEYDGNEEWNIMDSMDEFWDSFH